jgi:hypothetical protein
MSAAALHWTTSFLSYWTVPFPLKGYQLLYRRVILLTPHWCRPSASAESFLEVTRSRGKDVSTRRLNPTPRDSNLSNTTYVSKEDTISSEGLTKNPTMKKPNRHQSMCKLLPDYTVLHRRSTFHIHNLENLIYNNNFFLWVFMMMACGYDCHNEFQFLKSAFNRKMLCFRN